MHNPLLGLITGERICWNKVLLYGCEFGMLVGSGIYLKATLNRSLKLQGPVYCRQSSILMSCDRHMCTVFPFIVFWVWLSLPAFGRHGWGHKWVSSVEPCQLWLVVVVLWEQNCPAVNIQLKCCKKKKNQKWNQSSSTGFLKLYPFLY